MKLVAQIANLLKGGKKAPLASNYFGNVERSTEPYRSNPSDGKKGKHTFQNVCRFENAVVEDESNVFYPSVMRELFAQYQIDPDSLGSFVALCNEIEQEAKTSSLQRLKKCADVESFFQAFDERSEPPNYEINKARERKGRKLSKDFFLELLNERGIQSFDGSVDQIVKKLLEDAYVKGVNWVKDVMKDKVERLRRLRQCDAENARKFFDALSQDLVLYESVCRQ